MAVLHVTTNNFNEEVLKSDKPVLVDFSAVWCGPCQMIAPILEEVSNELEQVKICKVDIDESMELAVKYRIEVVPTLLVLKNGEVTNRYSGVCSKDAIKKLLEM